MLKLFTQTLFIFAVASFAVSSNAQTPTPVEVKKANERPAEKQAAEPFDRSTVAQMASQCVLLDTESGVIEIELYPESAPESVRNFLNLVATGLLNTTTFSRVVPDFVIQGGNFWTREGGVDHQMSARARRTIPDEPNKIPHVRGILSMARGEEANTATTNFFILLGDSPHLDGTFAAFGRVTKGMDVVEAIGKGAVKDEKPEKPVRIKKATVNDCSAASAN
jgi:peptidyl-prolyl cis-trans isomerase B (cyclophilin B)